MLKDQRDLLLAFNAHKVRYLVVGGYAYSFYAEPRATKDLYVFVDPTAENATAVFRALTDFGAPLAGMTAADFQDGKYWFQRGVALSRIDITQRIDAVDFDSAWQSSEPGMAADDIPVRYISLEVLIRNKLAAGRPRDLVDVEDLRPAPWRQPRRQQRLRRTKLIAVSHLTVPFAVDLFRFLRARHYDPGIYRTYRHSWLTPTNSISRSRNQQAEAPSGRSPRVPCR